MSMVRPEPPSVHRDGRASTPAHPEQPDPVAIFARLVEARQRRDASAIPKLQTALRRLGWIVAATTPIGRGGGA